MPVNVLSLGMSYFCNEIELWTEKNTVSTPPNNVWQSDEGWWPDRQGLNSHERMGNKTENNRNRRKTAEQKLDKLLRIVNARCNLL